MANYVIHRDGTREIFKSEKIIEAIKYILEGVNIGDPFVAMFKIIKNFELKLPNECSTQEIDDMLLKAIESLIPDDPDFDVIATKQLVKIINKNINVRFSSFAEYINFAVKDNLLSEKLLDFDIGSLELHINYDLDQQMNYFGLSTIKDRYLMKDRKSKIIEKPQRLWMRVAMGLALPEANKEEFAIKIYNKMARLKYLHSTPTLYNSGTPFPQLSSCYINVVGDSMQNIMDKATEGAMFAKYAGGIGTSVTKLRASSSHIKTINAKSSGPIPFIKIYDTVVNAIMQGGKRRSSQVIYMEPRHYNIHEFLDLKETNGNDYLRTRNLNTAVWIPDEFMDRVLNNEDRYLFDPAECIELTQTRGKEFSARYKKFCEKAENGEISLFKKIKAQDLYREILIKLAKTGNYWLNFKDKHNEKNQAPNYSMIHSSNLCTEISIPNSEESTAVCTLASLNLPRFVKKDSKKALSDMSFEEKFNLIDREDMKETIHTAIQALDNVVDVNFYPSRESEKNSLDLRPLGLGLMGLAELFIDLEIAYEDQEAIELSDKIGAFIYKEALAKSKDLAVQRGTFKDYDATRYSYEPRRNALLLAIAPTASISLIAGTSSTVDSFFANVYSRETLSGKFTIIIKQLVDKIKEQGLRNSEMKEKIIAGSGSIMHIPELDGIVDKNLFKTAYEISPFTQIDIASVLQKHVDQGISRNMYLKEDHRTSMFDIYIYAWKKNLKGTYYCFIEKTVEGEKYTQSVNKREGRKGFTIGTDKTEGIIPGFVPEKKEKVGFGSIISSQTSSLENIDFNSVTDEQKRLIEQKLRAEKGDEYVEKLKSGKLYDGACPVNPFEKVMCESCQ